MREHEKICVIALNDFPYMPCEKHKFSAWVCENLVMREKRKWSGVIAWSGSPCGGPH